MVGGRTVAKWGYLFLTPALGLLLVFRVLPALSALWHGLTRWNGVQAATFVGLANFAALLRDPVFWKAITNNLLIVASVPAWILVSLVLALLIHQETFGWRFFRASYFLPSVLSPVIIGALFFAFLKFGGPVDRGLNLLGLSGPALGWLGEPSTALPVLIVVILWGIFGHGVIVFLAGLAAVPREIFEAARLDGATGWRLLWHVVVPSLRHIIEFWGVNLVVWSFTSLFAFVYSMTQGGPGYATTVVSYYIYQRAFRWHQMGYACALGTAVFFLVFGIVLLQIRLMAGKE